MDPKRICHEKRGQEKKNFIGKIERIDRKLKKCRERDRE